MELKKYIFLLLLVAIGTKIEIDITSDIIIGLMEFNRLVSLVLGFIVLILIFVWIGSRFRSATREKTVTVKISITPTPTSTSAQKTSWNPLGFLFGDTTKTPTPSVVAKISPKTTTTKITNVLGQSGQNNTITSSSTQNTQVEYLNNKTGIKQIPATGAATMAIPLALSALSLGVYLRRKV